MPDLSLKAAHNFWHDYPDPTIYRVIAFLESMESWSLDGDSALEEAVDRMGTLLDEIDSFELGQENAIIDMCSHLKSSRVLRILQAIDTTDPGSASKVLMFAEENAAANNALSEFFIRRNVAFERLRLLSRVFSPERLDILAKAMEQE